MELVHVRVSTKTLNYTACGKETAPTDLNIRALVNMRPEHRAAKNVCKDCQLAITGKAYGGTKPDDK